MRKETDSCPMAVPRRSRGRHGIPSAREGSCHRALPRRNGLPRPGRGRQLRSRAHRRAPHLPCSTDGSCIETSQWGQDHTVDLNDCLQQSGTLAPGGTNVATRFRRIRWGNHGQLDDGSMHSFRLGRLSGTLPIGPRINRFRLNTERHVCGSSNPIAEERGTSCWALDLEFEADKEVVHELHFQCDLRHVASLSARDLFPPPRGYLLALGSVSLIVDTIRA